MYFYDCFKCGRMNMSNMLQVQLLMNIFKILISSAGLGDITANNY